MNSLIKNKKAEGETGSRGGAIIAALVALFVLIIVLLFLFGSSSDIVNRLRILLPGFNTNQTAAGKIELVGYDLLTNSLKFYDGTAWLDIQSDPQKIGNKKISKSQVSGAIIERFYTRNLPEKISLTTNSQAGERVYFPKEITIYSFGKNEKGKIRIKASYIDNGQKEAFFILDPDNSLLERTKEENREWEIGKVNEDITLQGTRTATLEVYNQFITDTYQEQFSTDVISHLKNINKIALQFSGWSLFDRFQYQVSSRTGEQLQDVPTITQALKQENEILLEKDYKLIKIEENAPLIIGEDYVKYQFYYKNSPIEIYLKLNRADVNNQNKIVYTLRGSILANELSQDTYVSAKMDTPEREIIEKTISWRDSVLKTPITLPYEENNPRSRNSFCIKKINNLLVINLAKSQAQCTT